MKKTLAGAALLVTTLTFAGCGDSSTSPDGGGTFDWSGSWVGTATETVFGTAPAEMQLSQNGSIVTGTAWIRFAGIPLVGAAAGTVTSTDMNLEVGIESGNCTIRLTGKRTGSSLSGPIAVARGTCTRQWAGTFNVTKQ